jgi:5-methylcytosine-specific restriction endonuclease McrA
MKARLLTLCEAQDWRCCYCGEHMTATVPGNQPDWTDATLEHKVPLSDGGTNDKTNLAAACRSCNQHQGNLTGLDRQARRYPLARLASIDPALAHLFNPIPAYRLA